MSVGVRTIEKMPDFGGSIAASATITYNIPLGRAFEVFYFSFTDGGVAETEAVLKSEVSTIKILKDGDPIMFASSTFLIDLRSFYGDARGDTQADDGIIPVNFALAHLRTSASERNIKLGTKDVKSLTAEVTFAGTVTNIDGAALYAERSKDEPMGIIRTIRKFPQAFATTGDHEISTLRRNPRDALMSLHTQLPGTSTVTEQILKVNNVEFYKATDAVNDNALKRASRTPQTGWHHMDFVRSNVLANALPFKGVEDLRLVTTWATAAPNSHDIYLETLEGVA